MKFWLSLIFEPVDSLLDHARYAEELGFEGVVLADHVVVKDGPKTKHPSGFPCPADAPFIDQFIAFSAMAVLTTRLRFLTYVCVVPLRDPFMLAKQIGSLALLSDNRFLLGTGVGWLREEFEAVGTDFSTRGQRMDEMLPIMRQFLNDGYAEFHGRFFDFPRSGMFPVPDRQVPFWIGGHSPAAAQRAARFDGYIPMRTITDPRGLLDDATQAEIKLIREVRQSNGIAGPYDVLMTAPTSLKDPGIIRRLEEVDGITNLLVEPWELTMQTAGGFDWTVPDEEKKRLTFEGKRNLAVRFAEDVIQKL